MSDFDLGAFLQAQQAEGTSVGEGGFTISHEKARAKMAQYSLPRRDAWVLKLVQAAVRWGCDEFELKQTRKDSLFFLRLTDASVLPSNKELLSAILAANLESKEAIHCLATAVRTLVEKNHLSFMLQVSGSEQGQDAIFAGAYFSEMDPKRREARRVGWGKGLTLMVHHVPHTEPNRLLHSYLSPMRYGLSLTSELDQYAYTAPLRLRDSGRRVNGVLTSSRMNWSLHLKPVKLAGVKGEALGPNLDLSDDFADRNFTVFTHPRRAQRIKSGSRDYPAFYLLSFQLPRLNFSISASPHGVRLVWVRDGVVVQEERIRRQAESLVGLFIFANAAGLETDLTGFQLIENDSYLNRKAAVLSAVATALTRERASDRDVFAEDRDDWSHKDDELDLDAASQERRSTALKLLLGGAALAPITGGASGLVGLVGSAKLALSKPAVARARIDRSLLALNYDRALKSLIWTLESDEDEEEEEPS